MVRFSYTPEEWESTNFYKPTTQDTKQEFETLCTLVNNLLGEFRPIVILGITDTVLWILKSHDRFKTPLHQRAELEKLLNPIADQVFEQMLQTTQRITDYSTPHNIEFHHDPFLQSMDNIVAYNLLIWVYHDGPWRRRPPPRTLVRKKAREMVLILNNTSAEPIDAQRETIDNLLYGVSDHICGLFVFVISKLFHEFVVRWDKVVLYTRPATAATAYCIDSRLPSSSSDGKVIETLLVFGWFGFESLRFWDDGEGADLEEGSGGFEESENRLGSVGASGPRDVPGRHRHRRSRKRNGGRSGVGGKDQVESKNRGDVRSS